MGLPLPHTFTNHKYYRLLPNPFTLCDRLQQRYKFCQAYPALLSNVATFCLLVVTPVTGTARPRTAG
jgi:hypothetical protein